MSLTPQTITLDLNPSFTQMQTVHCSQYDDKIRQIIVKLKDGGTNIDVSSYTIYIEGTKPDKHGFSYPLTEIGSVSSNTVTFYIQLQMCAVPGMTRMEVVLKSGTDRIGSANFMLAVERAGLQDDTDISETDIPGYIDGAQQAMEQAVEAAETASQAAETATEVLESIPADYTTLSNDVSDLLSAIKFVNNNWLDVNVLREENYHERIATSTSSWQGNLPATQVEVQEGDIITLSISDWHGIGTTIIGFNIYDSSDVRLKNWSPTPSQLDANNNYIGQFTMPANASYATIQPYVISGGVAPTVGTKYYYRNFFALKGTNKINSALKVDADSLNGNISPSKLTPLTDKYGMLLRYGVKCPNYDTTAFQLTIYANTVIFDLLTNTELIRTTSDLVLDAPSTAQVSMLVFNTTSNTFALKAQGRLSDTEVYLGAINRNTGKGQIKCTHTINGYPVGSDKLLAELAEKLPTAWQSKIEDINTAKGEKFTFAVQTDTHYYIGYGDTSAYNFKLLTNYVGFDFVTNLGDVIRGYADETIDSDVNMRKAMTDIMHRYVTGISCPLMIAMGNHDTNVMWANAFAGTPFTFAEVWGRIFRPSFNTNVKAVTQTGLMYYYTDYDDVRVIVLNTQDGANQGFGIGSEQLAWFTNTALNTDKWVLVMSHVPLVDGWSVSSNYVSSYADIVTALQAFKTNGGKVIGCMSGHTHTQENKTVDGILYVTFRNGADLAEVVMVDLENKTIGTIPVGFTGAGNRSFTFN